MRGFCKSIAWGVMGLTMAASAIAAREFPADAKRAEFTVVQYPVVKVGSKMLILAPGGQVRDESNLIVLPTSLAGKYRVLYTTDTNSDVFRVWILTPEELALLKSR